MSQVRVGAILCVATLPLLALTARAFVASPKGELTATDLLTYADGTKELEDARRLCEAASEGATREQGDPAGWRSPRATNPVDERIE